MSDKKNLDIVIRYDGNTADSGQLNLYQAAESLDGIARVVNVIVHAFANDGQIRERLTAPEGAETYLSAAKKGCFEEVVTVVFDADTVAKIKPSVIVNNFWDFLTASVSAAVGHPYDPSTPMVRKIVGKNETYFEEVAEELENALQKLQRPIKSKGAKTITFARPKSDDAVTLDKKTLAYVSVMAQEPELTYWYGNVTKYNSLSGYGRAYLEEIGETIPFKIDRFKQNISAQRAASASMDDQINELGGRRRIGAYAVRNSLGNLKRLTIVELILEDKRT
ncbi:MULTISPECIES: DUF7946 domain-containing protein [unclassified Janthinobacterium]|uniref:DUF7946 domain-containing protein n=1 Tax=unclassified Janthinobacterium TaxID=2610881 RepID=UPI0012F830AC|nr:MULTISPECIES: hypothetical protein [unclassified Janthinobacterium]MEC5161678.1 hypothetical protein [Janthinobacterium sp. CG_S6]